MFRRLTPLALIAALTPLTTDAASAPQGTPGQVQSINDLRNVGTAMWSWWKTEMGPRRSEEAHERAAAAAKSVTVADVSQVPVISRADLERLLVPKYIARVPEKDAWGNAYEYRLNVQDPNAEHPMALRTAGADGRFSGDVYQISDFPTADDSQDLAWMDGYFVRWPKP